MMRRCDSSDPAVVSAWLLEQARNGVSADASNYPLQLRVWPIPSEQRRPDGQPAWDWPINPGGFGMYDLTAQALGRLAQWLEAESDRAEFPADPIPSPEGM